MPQNLNASAQLANQGYLGDEIVTGEAVVLELPAATAFSRIVSGGIDVLFYGLLLSGTVYLLNEMNLGLADGLWNSLVIVLFSVYIWILPATVTALSRGSSLGKLLMRLRTVRLDGGTISTRQAFIRALAAIFEVWITLGSAAAITIFVSKRAQRIGDMLAGTYVVRWPKRARSEPELTMPAGLQKWAEIAQTSPLPAGLSLNIVNHFKTANKLTAQARNQQAQTLAAAAEKYVSPPAPWGTPPEEFLTALFLVRFQIETVNYQQEAAAEEKLMQRVQTLHF